MAAGPQPCSGTGQVLDEELSQKLSQGLTVMLRVTVSKDVTHLLQFRIWELGLSKQVKASMSPRLS